MPVAVRTLATLLFVCVVTVPAQPLVAPPAILSALHVTRGTIQDLAPSAANGPFTFMIWVGDQPHVARCEPHSMRSQGFRLLADTAAGLVPVTPPPVATCRGSIPGLHGSVVAVSRVGSSLNGIIRLPDRTIGIQPLSDFDPTAAPYQHVVYDSRDSVPNNGVCVAVPVPGISGNGGGGVRSGVGNLKYCEIAIDCDVQFYNANGGSMTATVLDAENVMNGTDAIYQSDVSIGYIITTIIVRTSGGSNPYSTNSSSGLLDQFRIHWNTNHTGVQRDVAHLMTGRNLSGSTIGIAYLGVICGGYGYGLGQRYTNSVTSRVGLTCHELGHNWNASHCSGGSCWIMCAGLGGCGGNVTQFSTGSINSILAFKASRPCLSGPPVIGPAQTLVRLPNRIDGDSSNYNVGSDGLTLGVGAGRMATAYADPRGAPPWREDIYVAVSSDEGRSFAAPQRVDLGDGVNAADSENPKVVVCASGAIVCAWEESRSAAAQMVSDSADVAVNRSADGGVTWGSVAYLNTGTAGGHVSSDAERIGLAVSDDTVYACWIEESTGGLGGAEQLRFARSTNAGQSWSAAAVLNTQVPGHSSGGFNHNDVDGPCLVADGDRVIIAFVDDRQQLSGANQDDVWVLVSQDRGVTWMETPLESGLSGDAQDVAVAHDGPRVIVSWRDDGSGDYVVHAVASQDGGVTWGAETVISQGAQMVSGASVTAPSVAILGSRAYVAWADDSAAGGGVGSSGNKAYVSVSQNGGMTWGGDVPLDAGSPDANDRPVVVAAADAVYVAMEYGAVGTHTLAYAYSRDGLTFQGPAGVPFSGPDVDLSDPGQGPTFLADPVSGAAVLVYRDFIGGGNEPFASAVRIPHLEISGTLTMGQPVSIGISDVPVSVTSGATFQIALSSSGVSPGIPTNVGIIHLLWDSLTTTSLSSPALLPALGGSVNPNGSGTGVTTIWPLPAGAPPVYAVGAVINPSGAVVALTDPIALITQ